MNLKPFFSRTQKGLTFFPNTATPLNQGRLPSVDGYIHQLACFAADIFHSVDGCIHQLACIVAGFSHSVDGCICQLSRIVAGISHSADGHIHQLECISAGISHSVEGHNHQLTCISAGKFAWTAPQSYSSSGTSSTTLLHTLNCGTSHQRVLSFNPLLPWQLDKKVSRNSGRLSIHLLSFFTLLQVAAVPACSMLRG